MQPRRANWQEVVPSRGAAKAGLGWRVLKRRGRLSGLAPKSYQNVSRETFLSGRGRKPYKRPYARGLETCGIGPKIGIFGGWPARLRAAQAQLVWAEAKLPSNAAKVRRGRLVLTQMRHSLRQQWPAYRVVLCLPAKLMFASGFTPAAVAASAILRSGPTDARPQRRHESGLSFMAFRAGYFRLYNGFQLRVLQLEKLSTFIQTIRAKHRMNALFESLWVGVLPSVDHGK